MRSLYLNYAFPFHLPLESINTLPLVSPVYMTKIKKPIDYINSLRFSSDSKTRKLGESLHKKYLQWTQSLNLKGLIEFLKAIQENREIIGVAQLFGKFRACSFEEFVYRLIQTKISIPEELNLYWGEKCLIWKESDQKYGMELDVLIGRKIDDLVDAAVAIDAKVELDASRLKTTLASFLLLKRWNLDVKCFLVYMLGEINPLLLKLSEPWIDGIYQIDPEKDETLALLKSIQDALKGF